MLRTQAQKGHTSMVRWLLDEGVSANTRGKEVSPLALAALNGHAHTVAELLERKASVKWRDAESGHTALIYAVSRDHAECVRLLLGVGADPAVKNKAGLNALHVAAASGAAKSAALLLEAGANWAELNADKLTALDMALLGQNTDVVNVIAGHGGRIDVKESRLSSLIEAVLRVDNALLLQRAIDDGWSASSKLDGWPALVVARQFGAIASIAALKTAGAQEDETGPDEIVHSSELQTAPKLVNAIMPRDPREVDEAFEEQTILVDSLIDAQGKLRFSRVVNAQDKRLAVAVLDSLARWEFSPAKRGGQAVAVRIRLPIKLPSSEKRVFAVTAVDVLPKPISQNPPVYPMHSRRIGEEARVVVRFVVTEEGRVGEVDVIERSSRECADAAAAAVRTWTFVPAKRGGKPVAVEMHIPIVFNLND